MEKISNEELYYYIKEENCFIRTSYLQSKCYVSFDVNDKHYIVSQLLHKLSPLNSDDKFVVLINYYALSFDRNGKDTIYKMDIYSARDLWDGLQGLEFDYKD